MASSSAAASLLPPRADIFFVPRTELERSPSVLDHTFASWADELAWREEQCAFIHELGSALKISQMTTIATACVYLHRFFSRHSFAKHRDIVVVCGACIFLACKVEESRRKVSFLIERLRATVDPAAVALHPEAPEFVRMRDAIFDCERDVLDTIEYRLHVDLPYHYLVEAINKKACRGLQVRADGTAREEGEIHGIATRAWQLTNESIKSATRLLYAPQTIAVACLSVALEEDFQRQHQERPEATASAASASASEGISLAGIAAEFNVDAAQCADVRAMTLATMQRALARRERGAGAGAGPGAGAAAAGGSAGGSAGGNARTPVSAHPPSAHAHLPNAAPPAASSAASSATATAASAAAKRSIDQVRDADAVALDSRVGDHINSAEGGGKVARLAHASAAPALPSSSSSSPSSARVSISSASAAPASSSVPISSSSSAAADADPFQIDDDELAASSSSAASLAPGTGDHLIPSALNASGSGSGSGSGSVGGSLTHSSALNDSWESNSLPPNASHGLMMTGGVGGTLGGGRHGGHGAGLAQRHGLGGMQSCERGDHDGDDDAQGALGLGAATPFLGGDGGDAHSASASSGAGAGKLVRAFSSAVLSGELDSSGVDEVAPLDM